MRESHDFKLSSSLFHSSFKDKHLNIHRVRNSILRNVITQSSDQQTIDRHNENYEKYLKLNPLYKDQLAHFLRCICDNPQRSVPNKNVIKRVMIDFFDDDVMNNIKDETFFNTIELKQWKRGIQSNIHKGKKNFYLILKGRLIFRNSVGSTKVKARQCYGHEEILCGETIQQIQVVSDSVVFVIQEEVFNKCLRESFDNKLKSNWKKLCKHPCFEYQKQEFEIMKLLLRMTKKEFQQGETIAHEGDAIEQIYFLVKGRLDSENQHIHRIKGVGLKQIANCQCSYQETIQAQTTCEVLSLPVSLFKRSYYLKWIRDTLPDVPRFVMINIEEIGKDKKSSFKVRKTSMSIKKSLRGQTREKSQTQPVSFDNNFLFLNERPIKKKSLV